jgi:hypothetical protein
MKWLKKYISALSGDIYTLIGLGIAYFTLDGNVKKITGLMILIGVFLWLLTLPIRESDDDE